MLNVRQIKADENYIVPNCQKGLSIDSHTNNFALQQLLKYICDGRKVLR
jgi:hypothetical protein